MGDYIATGDATLVIELGGLEAGTQHDQLIITGGAASLGGTLALSLIDDFEPQLGDEFTILTIGAMIGQFGAVTGHQIAPDRWLAAVYDSSAVRLVTTVPGDANLDSQVNIADLGILAANWQQSGRSWIDADFTGTGTVNIADLGVLAANWQVGTSGASSKSFEDAMAMFDAFDGVVVPEPVGAAGGLAVLGLFARRRRR